MADTPLSQEERAWNWVERNLSSTPIELVTTYIAEYAKDNNCKGLMKALVGRFGQERINVQMLLGAESENNPDPFKGKIVKCSELPGDEEIPRIWFGIYPGKLHLYIGESNAGKSSFLMNFGIMAARNEDLYGIPFMLGRPIRVLYLDAENFGGTNKERIKRIEQGEPDDFVFADCSDVDLSNAFHLAALERQIVDGKYDVCILDPIATLFNTVSEDDNSEAARQMKALIKVCRNTNCAIIIVHHTGKSDTDSAYGRGASARLGAADVSIMFRSRGSDDEVDDTYTGEVKERADICRLQIAKDRPGKFGKCSVYLQMAGMDRFQRSTWDAWKQARKATQGAQTAQDAQSDVMAFLASGDWQGRQEIIAAMTKEGIGINSTDFAIKSLIASGSIDTKKSGRINEYRLAQAEDIGYRIQGVENTDDDDGTYSIYDILDKEPPPTDFDFSDE